MADYIDREAAIMRMKDLHFNCKDFHICGGVLLELNALASLPAADVRPVVRGRWTWDENGVDWGIGAWRCSACGMRPPMWWNTERTSPMNKNGHCFCPNCGAEMEASE